MGNKKYLLSEIQKEAYEKGIDAPERKLGFMWGAYEEMILNDDIRENLINDGGYELFKETALDYVLSEKKDAVFLAGYHYKQNVSLIENGSLFPETRRKKREKKCLLSKIQKETHEKGIEAKTGLDELLREHGFFPDKASKERAKELDLVLRGTVTWGIYKNTVSKGDIQKNLVSDNGYKPFKELAHNYILHEKNQAIDSAERSYKCRVSWIETGKLFEETKGKEIIKIDTPLSTAAFIIGTTISGGDPKVGKAFAKFIKKIERRNKK